MPERRILNSFLYPPPGANTAQHVDFSPADLIPIEEVARRLHAEVAWVREKCRRRCPNPIPVYNLGRHLLFDWRQVSEWIRNSTRPVHAKHRRRKKSEGSKAA